jgi:hypothetical protein
MVRAFFSFHHAGEMKGVSLLLRLYKAPGMGASYPQAEARG